MSPMREEDQSSTCHSSCESPRPEKKPYEEPSFRFEKVFETMALACGKIQATNFECRFHRNSS